MVTIPFSEFPAFSQEIILDNIPFRVSFNWNTRGEYWTLSILDRDENQLASGIKIVLDYELIARYPGRGLPPGEIYAIDTSGELDKIGRDDFQDRASLVYVLEGEVL